MNNRKFKGRKWKATKATLILEFAASLVGIAKFAFATEPAMAGAATNFVLACFGCVAGTLAFYFAANVMNSRVVAKDFHQELVEKE